LPSASADGTQWNKFETGHGNFFKQEHALYGRKAEKLFQGELCKQPNYIDLLNTVKSSIN